ncbi:hypothetical protein FMM05_03695 [Flavobacterium zepuense]|uniref:Uncharacterized protein n=1 Tax=Flavobacterium zepuense TaxID=2593302 RepID=A0A552V7P8_9FLAO|nr:hypothetical protein [Flavobacterium zepuense]TRW26492.1 hypothetical protein FMM05_03695 [Flavobacterium zepuense]
MKAFQKIIAVIVLFAFSASANAQCAMCRAALESSDSGIKPESVNNGIIYLMIFPYLLAALLGYAIYRLRKQKKQKQAQ